MQALITWENVSIYFLFRFGGAPAPQTSDSKKASDDTVRDISSIFEWGGGGKIWTIRLLEEAS